jgi:hypothetical protein
MANPIKPHEQYKQMMKLMVSEENGINIEEIVVETARAYKIDMMPMTSNLGFIYGVTYRVVMLIARLAKSQGLTNFWLGGK